MEKKVIKRLAMLSLVSIFTLCAAVASANAQLSYPIRAKIPFDFSVGDKKLAAGEYSFRRLSGVSDSTVIQVSGLDTGAHVYQSTLGAHLHTPRRESTLVFHKYGDQYFLDQIWSGGEQEGAELPESRGERTAAATGTNPAEQHVREGDKGRDGRRRRRPVLIASRKPLRWAKVVNNHTNPPGGRTARIRTVEPRDRGALARTRKVIENLSTGS